MRIRLSILLTVAAIPLFLGAFRGPTSADTASASSRIINLGVPGYCMTPQPTLLTVEKGGKSFYATGGGEECYWEIQGGVGDIYLFEAYAWMIGWTDGGPGGMGEGEWVGMTVAGEYDDGSAVSIREE
jgi:hypothetical protein